MFDMRIINPKFFIIILFAVFSFGMFSSSFANQADEMMKQANNYYQLKQYDKAISIYQQIIHEGYVGTALYYNLGNAYYRENKIGLAILYYQKALQLSPGDNDVQHNLAIANTKTVDKIETLPPFFLFQWWESLLAFFSVNGWTYLAYIFYILFLSAIGFYFFAKKPKMQRYSFFGGLASVVLLIISISLLIINLNRQLNIKNAIVIVPAVTVKLSPDNSSNDAFIIHEGLKVREEDHVDNWVKIQLQDGKEGWLPEDKIATI
jgi:tetratricopeptide (TPR) repeat protein